MEALNSKNIIGRASKLLWKIQHGGSLGMVDMEELEDKEFVTKSKLKYSNSGLRGERAECLFQILENNRR